jgi:hypothetical protein
LTAVVEFDVAVDVESIVDLDVDLDHRSRLFDEDSESTRRSTYKVEVGVDVYVAVQVKVFATTSRSTSTSSQGCSRRFIDTSSASVRLRIAGRGAATPDGVAASLWCAP